jgi:hypothetical protein
MNPKAKDVAYWIYAREQIRLRKEAGKPQPWTDDTILQKYRFCNVNREHDRVTRWLDKHWRRPFHDHPNFILAMLLARMINWPPTLAEIGFPDKWRPRAIVQTMQNRAARGEKTWTSAYVVTTCGKPMNKAEYVVQYVCDRVYRVGVGYPTRPTLAAVWTALRAFDGLGAGFLAAQVVADLKNSGHVLAQAKDWWTWAAPGPGSLRGLSTYFGQNITRAEFLLALHDMQEEVYPMLGRSVPRLCSQNWQNVMCEMDKYWRVEQGRRPKQNYQPETAYDCD